MMVITKCYQIACFVVHSHAESLQAPPHPEPQALPTVQPETEVHAEPSGSTGALLPNITVDPRSLQPQSSTAGAPTVDSIAAKQPLSTQTPPTQQRLGEDLFRLVQVRRDLPKGKLWTLLSL